MRMDAGALTSIRATAERASPSSAAAMSPWRAAISEHGSGRDRDRCAGRGSAGASERSIASSVPSHAPSLTFGTASSSGASPAIPAQYPRARLDRPGSVAQRLERTTHNREVGGSNPPGAMKFRSGMQFCSRRTAIRRDHFVVRSSIARFRLCRARSDGTMCTGRLGRPPRVHRSPLAAKRASADDRPATTVGNRAHCDSEPTPGIALAGRPWRERLADMGEGASPAGAAVRPSGPTAWHAHGGVDPGAFRAGRCGCRFGPTGEIREWRGARVRV